MPKLLSLKQTAELLGYSVKGLRKIVIRSKAKAAGARTRGPTITFLQAGPKSPIKFKEEWIEEFIERYTVNPPARKAAPRKKRRPALDTELFNV